MIIKYCKEVIEWRRFELLKYLSLFKEGEHYEKKLIFWLGVCFSVVLLNFILLSQTPFQVTHETGGAGRFAWSPDSRQFAYAAFCDNVVKLYRIDLNGSNEVTLTSNVVVGSDGNIDWKGNVIIFKDTTGGTSYYDMLLKKINPDDMNEAKIVIE